MRLMYGGSGNETNVYVDVAAGFQTFDLFVNRLTGLQTGFLGHYTKVKGSTTLQKHTGPMVIPSTICRNIKKSSVNGLS